MLLKLLEEGGLKVIRQDIELAFIALVTQPTSEWETEARILIR